MMVEDARSHRGPALWLAGLALVVGGCASESGESEGEGAPAEAAPAVSGETGAQTGAADATEPEGGESMASEPNPLMNPSAPEMNMMAPAEFRVRLVTSQGDVVLEIHRDWAPNGVDRFFNLVRHGFFDGARFFRVLEGFVAQFGIHGDPAVQRHWRTARIPDDPVVESNTRGRVTFAMGGPNSRSTQLFINYADNSRLDLQPFAPIGEVVEGMDVVESLYSGYGEGAPRGGGPDQSRIQMEGNEYLTDAFPDLDYIERAEIIS